MNGKVNPEMLILAREARGLIQSALAELLETTQATVSRYESGLVEAPCDYLGILAKALRRPVSFFYWQDRLYSSSCLYHRRRSRITLRDLKMIHAHVNLLRMQTVRLLRFADIQSDYCFHRLDAAKCGGPEDCARQLRQLWQLPTGPIRNLVRTIESAGGVVLRCPFGVVNIDGISQWPLDAPAFPPVFFIHDEAPGDRCRRTLAHEIGHIVMHHLPTEDPEQEADRFASEFLMPADEIESELSNMTLQKAAALKTYWKTSMQSIIVRAYRLGKIELSSYEYLFRQITERGYRRCEPVPIPPEEPEMIRELFGVYSQSARRSLKEIAESLGMLEAEMRTDYWRGLFGLRLVG
jgi:Zn-dependent peptidase ImmA (M78 family)/transcriptional regulator with XRE-family HTH domain